MNTGMMLCKTDFGATRARLAISKSAWWKVCGLSDASRQSQRNGSKFLGHKRTSDYVHQYIQADASERRLTCCLNQTKLRVCFAVLKRQNFTWAVADAFCMHDISSCSMYATPAVGRPSECETLLKVSSRQEMRSLSPGRVIPLRTSAKKAKDSKESAPETSSLQQQFSTGTDTKRGGGSLGYLSSLCRAVGRIFGRGLKLSNKLDEQL